MKRAFLIISIIFISNCLFAQGEVNDPKVYNIKEKTFGLMLNSNGYGLNLRYGKRVNATVRRILDYDFEYVKHQKEIKARNPYNESSNRFVFGKLNTFFNTRGGIGIQKEIFSKFDKGSVAIKYFYSGGISLGILKPIYYEVIDSIRIDLMSNHTYTYTTPRTFNYSIHTTNDIYGRTSFFKKGLNEIELIPGLNLKGGVCVEYSKQDKIINAIEIGIIADIYSTEVPIMETYKNSQFFLSLYISYRFGKVYYKKKID